MNKDQKLIAEAYDQIQFTKRKKPFLEKPGRLNPTADLEKIADFLNQNDVCSGGWQVQDGGAVKENTSRGHVKIVPEKRGLIVTSKQDGREFSSLYSWPVEARHLNQQLS